MKWVQTVVLWWKQIQGGKGGKEGTASWSYDFKLSLKFFYGESLLTSLVVNSLDFPGGSDSKASAYNAGDPGSIPGSGRSPGEGNGTPLQYSCLENPMDGGAW